MTCQNQAGYGIFSEVHSWKMIKLKEREVYILKSTYCLNKLLTFSKRETSNLRVNGRKV
jgi:hypothetical protein